MRDHRDSDLMNAYLGLGVAAALFAIAYAIAYHLLPVVPVPM